MLEVTAFHFMTLLSLFERGGKKISVGSSLSFCALMQNNLCKYMLTFTGVTVLLKFTLITFQLNLIFSVKHVSLNSSVYASVPWWFIISDAFRNVACTIKAS